MLEFIISFFVGVLISQTFTRLLPLYVTLILFFLAIIALIVLSKQAKIRNFLVALLLGMAWASTYAAWVLQHQLPDYLENKPIYIEGIITEVPVVGLTGTRFVVHIKKILSEPAVSFQTNTRLFWQNAPALQVGQTWQLVVKLKSPHATLNPNSFDEEAWLLQHAIRATGYVVPAKQNHVIYSSYLVNFIDKQRQTIADQIANVLQNNSMTGFITALAVGIRDAINPEQWQILRETGTNHLMAIAGLHIGFVAALVFYLAKLLWRRFPFLMLRVPAPFAAAIAALMAAVIYGAFAGFALPTQRAIIMLAIVLLAIITRRHLFIWQAVALALFFILLSNPLIILSSSFWLSFATVAIIIFSLSARLQAEAKIWRWLRIQMVIAIGLMPWMLWFFQQISFISFLANLIAIPWVGLLVLPFTLMGAISLLFSPFLAKICFHCAAYFMQWLWLVLTKMTAYSWLQWYDTLPTTAVLIAAICATLLLLAPRGFPARWLSGIFILPIFFWPTSQPKLGAFNFTLLDVGEGLSAIVQTRHHALIYDTGAKYGIDNDAAQAVIIPFLRGNNIKKIDNLIISNNLPEHIGGANTLLTTMPVTHIITAVPYKFSAIAQRCQAGQHWQWDGVDFLMLDTNCTLKISAENNNVLITSDLTQTNESNLLRNAKNNLTSSILVAPHHGSLSGYNANFAAAVAAKYVLFSTGYLNRYHFPNDKVVQAYRQNSVLCYNTAQEGALSFYVTPKQMTLDRYRQAHGHYWNHYK